MKKITLILTLLILVVISTVAVSCGGKDDGEKFQIGYSGGNIGYGFQYTTYPTGNRISENLNRFTSDGHHLVGFFTEEGIQYFDGEGKQLPEILIDRDINVIAKEEPNQYKLNFDAGDGVILDAVGDVYSYVTYGQEQLADIYVPYHENVKYEFDGWFNDDVRYTDGGTLVFDNFASFNHGDEINLTARYKAKEYTVILNFNDGVTEKKEIKVKHGDRLGSLSEYYMDNGEMDITDWSLVSYANVSVPEKITEDMNIFAVWTRYKDVTFHLNGTSFVQRVHMIPGESTVLPTDVAPGYKVEEWYESSIMSGNPIVRVPYGALADTYYGEAKKTSYQITFSTEIGESPDAIPYEYGDEIELPVLFDEGHLFLGWVLEGTDDIYYVLERGDWGSKAFYAKWLESTPIYSVEDFEQIRQNPMKTYHLTCDIDLQGQAWAPITTFDGVFNGQGYVISNYVLTGENDVAGFFGRINGTVSNTVFRDAKLNYSTVSCKTMSIGAICGKNMGIVSSCVVENASFALDCISSTSVEKLNVGGAVGLNVGEMTDIQSSANITVTIRNSYGGTTSLGGMAGKNEGDIILCEAEASILDYNQKREYSSMRLYMGGLTGINDGFVEKCSTNASIESKADKSNTWDSVYMGGLIGSSSSVVSQSLSKGSLTLNFDKLSGGSLGGLVGSGTGDIKNCYSLASLYGSIGEYCSAGGLCGSFSGSILNSYTQNECISVSGGKIGGIAGTLGGDGFAKGSFTSYSCSFGDLGGDYSNCSFYMNAVAENVLFDVLKWDTEAWEMNGTLPELEWNMKWIDIEIPELPELDEGIYDPEPPTPFG